MTRIFFALDLGAAAREALRRQEARLARALPDLRLPAPEDLHLTLAFLGEVDDETLARVIALNAEVASQARPFELTLAGLGVFGPPTAPRVIWAGVGGQTRPLLTLQRRLATALEAEGFPREQRAYSPHLTLARLKRPLDEAAAERLRALLSGPPPTSAPWRVNDLRVMRSDLAATGARYTALSVAPLGGRPHADG